MIVDTSVLFDALVPGPATGAARELLQSADGLRAPDLIVVEAAGALTKAVRRGDIAADFATRAFAAASQLLPALEPTRLFLDRSVALSFELMHPLYDCIFLAHAEIRADVFVTADDRFLRKLQGTAHAARAIHVRDWRP